MQKTFNLFRGLFLKTLNVGNVPPFSGLRRNNKRDVLLQQIQINQLFINLGGSEK